MKVYLILALLFTVALTLPLELRKKAHHHHHHRKQPSIRYRVMTEEKAGDLFWQTVDEWKKKPWKIDNKKPSKITVDLFKSDRI